MVKNNMSTKNTYRHNAFTFAELMISLVIIAVITAILYPTISEIAPNNNQYLFKSAYKTVETVISEIINESDKNELFESGANDRAITLCDSFKEKLNTVNAPVSPCTADTPWLTTSNGMRWYFTTKKNEAADADGNVADIDGSKVALYIDVNASNNKEINITGDDNAPPCTGTPQAWDKGCFRQEDNVVRDTFMLIITNTGKIEGIDNIGINHLLDESRNN